VILNRNHLAFDSAPTIVFEMQPVFKFKREPRREDRFFGAGEFDDYGFANDDGTPARQSQQGLHTGGANIRKKASQPFRAAQFGFYERCGQYALHSSAFVFSTMRRDRPSWRARQFEDTHRVERK
jgi:hypothetical protein